ncbi:MAG: hypothetical protein RR675_04640 [Oscillospiraceae bacterium]
MKTIKARITFTEELLGTASNDKEIHAEFIASKAPDAQSLKDEVAAVGIDEVVEKQMTVFPRNENGKAIIYDYQLKGFFKDSCASLRKVSGTASSKIKAFKKEIDGLIFVFPRMIEVCNYENIGNCQRPLRAQTAQGERIALANSETIPQGAYIDVEIRCLSDEHEKLVIEWLDYGELRGLGQWRNSGKGRFTWEKLE